MMGTRATGMTTMCIVCVLYVDIHKSHEIYTLVPSLEIHTSVSITPLPSPSSYKNTAGLVTVYYNISIYTRVTKVIVFLVV